jgi:flagellar basal-body rod protein FlgG
MDAGLYIAAQGMLAEQVRQDQLSNNLSNASTPGYKPQLAQQKSFDSLLLANSATGQPIGSLQTGVDINKVVTDTAPSALQSTGDALDFGISGNGYFAVRTAGGVRYTQDGQFTTNNRSQLVDTAGDLVLSQNGQPITVDGNGDVAASKLGVFNLANASEQGDNLFTGTVTGRASGVAHSGELEESGVDSVSTMTDMIASLRAYQAGQSAIQSIDQTMQEDATNVGSLQGG